MKLKGLKTLLKRWHVLMAASVIQVLGLESKLIVHKVIIVHKKRLTKQCSIIRATKVSIVSLRLASQQKQETIVLQLIFVPQVQDYIITLQIQKIIVIGEKMHQQDVQEVLGMTI